jgi:DNA-binding transcriptional ArsR family regulator
VQQPAYGYKILNGEGEKRNKQKLRNQATKGQPPATTVPTKVLCAHRRNRCGEKWRRRCAKLDLRIWNIRVESVLILLLPTVAVTELDTQQETRYAKLQLCAYAHILSKRRLIMSESPFSLPKPATVAVNATLATVPSQLFSLWALTADGVAADDWIAQAAAHLSPEQRRFNRLLFAAFGTALLPAETYANFPGYLAALPGASFPARLAEAAQSVATPALRAEAAAALVDPAALQQQIVDHLHSLWETLLAPEWQRHTRLLAKMTSALNELIFSQPQWQAATPFTALRFLLQTEPDDCQLAQLAGVRRILVVLSPHLHVHLASFDQGETLWVVRTFDPQLLRRDPLRRAEALGPLNALADDTRLRILELLVEHGEQRAQEIIAQLEGSQGNVSRHLKQLVGAGLARERRAGDANKLYTYAPAGLQRVMFLVRQLLSSHNVQAVGQESAAAAQLNQARAGAPPTLRDLLDEQGRITRWSSKLKDQAAMLRHLIEKFEPERGYTEQQVNALLQQWYLDADFVLVRRSLIDAGLLQRTRDGARYWRTGLGEPGF